MANQRYCIAQLPHVPVVHQGVLRALRKLSLWAVLNSLRQNKETHLEIGQDEVVNKIEFRISRYTFLPGYNGEPMHMMYTTPGHGYGA